MEIEAKFAVPNAGIFQRLQALDRLAGFALSTSRVKHVHDTYLDTPDRAILAAGYACRRREQSDGVWMTLKGLGSASGPIHRREELEVWLPADQPPTLWPAGPARERVLHLTGGAPLGPLFELRQVRTVRSARQGERVAAELSLDEVQLNIGEKEIAYFELEAELAPQGAEEDLEAMARCLLDEWGLAPEPRSKFERALALLQTQT